MKFIESLEKEKYLLLDRLIYLDELIKEFKAYDSNTLNEIFNAVKNKRGFPISGKKSQKVLWLFENVFKTGQKFLQIQEAFNEYNGLDEYDNQIKLEGTVRGLKTSGKLAVVKYNKSNKLSFWGLTDWVDDNGFKDEYKPKEEFLPTTIESIEVIK